MNKQLTLLALLVGATFQAQAAQAPFFTITEDQSGTLNKGYEGPWALGISQDGSSLLGLHTDNDAGAYFSTVPFADLLVDRFRFESNCIQASSVCYGYWDEQDHRGYQWRRDFLDGSAQRANTGALTGDEYDGLVTALGESAGENVGYLLAQAPYRTGASYRQRTAFAEVAGERVALEAAFKLKNDANGDINSLSMPNGITKLGDHYLVTGTVATATHGDSFGYCHGGNSEEAGDYRFCPGFDTQAAFWLLDSNGKSPQLSVAPSYYKPRSDVLQTAAARDVAQVGETLYGVGYSSTGDVGSGTLDGRNVAVYWPLSLSGDQLAVGALKAIPLALGEPGNGDGHMRHSWAVALTEGGYVIGNQKFNTAKNRNLPTEMFIYQIGQSGNATVPFADNPLEGAGSEAIAANDHNMVVGWRDARGATSPVYQGTNRLQEAFLLNAAAPGNNWYLNDLICGKSDSGEAQCSQNGHYYHLAYASGISANGTIAATAYRYASKDDWENRQNAVVVSVKLTPADVDYSAIDSKYVVANLPATNSPAEDNGGGSLFWLTLLAAPLAWWRRRR